MTKKDGGSPSNDDDVKQRFEEVKRLSLAQLELRDKEIAALRCPFKEKLQEILNDFNNRQRGSKDTTEIGQAEKQEILPEVSYVILKDSPKGELFKYYVKTTFRGSVNESDSGKRTPLHWACIMGHESTVKILLEKGADLLAQDQEEMMAIHYACKHGHEAATKALLEYCKQQN
eukprot:GCRY01002760.1.p1 GENE.GCRY01002760.1~~GCRY01002760.1.p1  ORF type:complete len:174 (-),score=33.54 GCRY01002760.1:124-645(-)